MRVFPVPGSRFPGPGIHHNRSAAGTSGDRDRPQDQDGGIAALDGALDAEPRRGGQAAQRVGRHVDQIDRHQRADAGLHDQVE
jgi:hypothetical protein